jgi:hypothetical protein
VREIAVTDVAVHPNAQCVHLGHAARAPTPGRPLRVDGAGKMDIVEMNTVKFSKVTLPNPPAAMRRRGRPTRAVGHRHGRRRPPLRRGLSNEEFASKLRSVSPVLDRRQRDERRDLSALASSRRAPGLHVRALQSEQHDEPDAGYPLRRSSVPVERKAGAKVMGRHRGLGSGNRPIDMIVVKDGKEFLLMSNTSRGAPEDPDGEFRRAGGHHHAHRRQSRHRLRDDRDDEGTEQLDLLDDTRTLVLQRTEPAC